MRKHAILLGHFDKQPSIINKIYKEIVTVDLYIDDKQFLFAVRVQQFYTAIEDLFKQIAKSFKNHIEDMSNFPKEMLSLMNTEVPKIRPCVIFNPSFLLLDKIRAFCHFIWHAYNIELDVNELLLIQKKLSTEFSLVQNDLKQFREFIQTLSE